MGSCAKAQDPTQRAGSGGCAGNGGACPVRPRVLLAVTAGRAGLAPWGCRLLRDGGSGQRGGCRSARGGRSSRYGRRRCRERSRLRGLPQPLSGWVAAAGRSAGAAAGPGRAGPPPFPNSTGASGQAVPAQPPPRRTGPSVPPGPARWRSSFPPTPR